MNIGQRIKQARTKNGLTQKQLGEILGSTQQMMAQYESGKHIPKIDTLNRIADALNISISDLMGSDLVSLTDSVIDLFSGSNDVKLLGDSTKIDELYFKLNDEGQEKAIAQVELLTKIPEYRREEN